MPAPPLLGTDPAPAVHLGRRVHCRHRGNASRVTSFTDAPIPWPRVQPLDERVGSGLWVNADLERAIRTESAVALGHWFGRSKSAARALRVWAGVEGWEGTRGTRRAVTDAADAGADATRGVGLSKEACEVRAANAKRLKLIEHARAKRWPVGWAAEMDALLGVLPDEVVAKRAGESWAAVQSRRAKLGIPPG